MNDLKKNFNLNYLAPMNLNQIYESGAQFDACISSATLEHLPKNELDESFKILKKIVFWSCKLRKIINTNYFTLGINHPSN